MSWWIRYALLLPHIYLLSLRLTEGNCQIGHYRILLPKKIWAHLLSKIGINQVLSTIFSTVLELLQTVYREKTELQLIVFMDEKLSRALDRKSVITVPRQHKNFLVAWAKNAKSHINRCLVTLLLNVVYLPFIWHKFPEHTFWNRSFNTLKYTNSPTLVKN